MELTRLESGTGGGGGAILSASRAASHGVKNIRSARQSGVKAIATPVAGKQVQLIATHSPWDSSQVDIKLKKFIVRWRKILNIEMILMRREWNDASDENNVPAA